MMDASRRNLLKAAAILMVDHMASTRRSAFAAEPAADSGRKVIIVACGGVRRAETFSASGFQNIPHLYKDLLPQSVFYPFARNAGVTSHYNTISSILTGNWQRLDDWGMTPPASPTMFEHMRKRLALTQDKTWLISSNKALTSRIGASSVRGFGPSYGANVVFPKQLLINAVVRAAAQGHAVHSADRSTVQPEFEAMLKSDNYDGLGWAISGDTSFLDPRTQATMQQAIEDLVHTNAPATGDEFTFLVSAEVMRRFAPSLLVVTFSDMEVAHFGSYAMHLGGIRSMDRLVSELWSLVGELPAYKGKTSLFVLPEFGRDLDGSNTNGFFNHRQNDDSTRLTWMMCLGDAVRKAQVIEHPVEHTDLCPTIAQLFGLKDLELPGKPLPGLEI
ncbi:MAG: hypothetical protein P4K97_09565 [Terracidiphilus sp.]|nr:hypothetical protein [Terracidiphilus sp.]